MAESRLSQPALTVERLREWLDYDPATGAFLWKVDLGPGRPKPRDIAGCANDEGYWLICFRNRSYRAHRLAWLFMTGIWPGKQIDHKDRNRSNNKWSNLRLATGTENNANTTISCKNTTGAKGVSWHKRDRVWYARIKVNGKTKHLGIFSNKEDAAGAYAVAAQSAFGKFARIV